MRILQRTNSMRSLFNWRVMADKALMLCLAAACMTFMSCEQDAYDKGEGAYSNIQADFGEAHSNSSKTVDYIITDDDDRLVLTNPFQSKSIATADSLYRVVAYYDKVEQGQATIRNIGFVPVLSVTDIEEFENFTADPVKLESVWTSKNGKYVNIAIWLKNGTIGENDEKHSLGMVNTGVRHNDDGTTTTCLRLHHDQGDVPEYYSNKYYLSLAVSDIEGDSVCVTVNTYDGEKEKVVRIR